jgi:hypothetical protein
LHGYTEVLSDVIVDSDFELLLEAILKEHKVRGISGAYKRIVHVDPYVRTTFPVDVVEQARVGHASSIAMVNQMR